LELLNDFLSWVWPRHHNELSWYVRPLFILPFCWFAYRRSAWGIVVTLLVFPTSLFWFPAPDNPSPRVEGYLEWERQFLTGGSVAARVALAARWLRRRRARQEGTWTAYAGQEGAGR
jgi:hypothetical protein